MYSARNTSKSDELFSNITKLYIILNHMTPSVNTEVTISEIRDTISEMPEINI